MPTREESPLVTLCIPHWQIRDMISICLRSIRRHSQKYSLEVMVVDNGSRDESIDYLRSLPWIRLIERPEQGIDTWPSNVHTAWDLGARAARGEYFVAMHSDVFVKSDDWLDPLLREISVSPQVAAAGAWKLQLESPIYAWQKRVLGSAVAGVKRLLGRQARSSWRQGHFPRDYCAMYRRDVLVRHDLRFWTGRDPLRGGFAIARQIWKEGYETRMVPVWEMAQKIVHVAHGTAAVAEGKPLQHRTAQLKAERRVRALLEEDWVRQLRDDARLDAA